MSDKKRADLSGFAAREAIVDTTDLTEYEAGILTDAQRRLTWLGQGNPVLKSLVARGLVKVIHSGQPQEPDEPPRCYFNVTDRGRAALRNRQI